MKRVRLTVAYDGTNYHGWQLQDNAITIESELNRCLSELLSEDIKVIGASRTDTGVHALGNVAVFDTEARIPGDKVSFALNTKLPEDIRIQHSEEVSIDWHPRHQDCRKTYEYRIFRGQMELPTKRLYSHFVYRPIDVAAMQRACGAFLGEHDFQSLCAAGSQALTTVRTIYSLEVEEQGSDVVIRVCGNGFLYNMVRILAGTLLDVGLGKKSAEEMDALLEGRDRRKAGPTLPAKGLTLIGYEYPEEEAQ